MEPVALGWTPLLDSWMNTLPGKLNEHVKYHLRDMFLRFCPALLHLIRRCGVKVRWPPIPVLIHYATVLDCLWFPAGNDQHAGCQLDQVSDVPI